MKKLLLLLFLAVIGDLATGADFPLVKDGKAASVIVLPENAGPVEKHAANELSVYLGKISGGTPVQIVKEPSNELYNIYLGSASDKNVAAKVDGKLYASLMPEGFILSAGSNGLVVLGKEPVGVLYGVYEVLKKYGGIRWLVPEDDGEYFTIKPTITMPEQSLVRNPSFTVRTLFFGSANITSPMWGTYDWMVRNNMRIENFAGVLDNPKLMEKLVERGAVSRDGLHAFSPLLSGKWVKIKDIREAEDFLKKMFEEHPDRFPLLNGKRVPLDGEKNQPCTSNPEVLEIMSENLSLWVKNRISPGGYYVAGNNDGTGWCQCPECTKLDPLPEKEIGVLSTRYWTYANKLIGNVLDKYPDARIWGWAYQNFQQPPIGIVPDKRIHVMQTYNRRCYRHKLTDPNCQTNKVFYEYFKGWSKLGNPTSTWEQIDASAICYMPVEETFIDSIMTYHKLNMQGVMPVVAPIAEYQKHFEGTLTPLSWYAMWQTLYLSANFLWDVNSDYDKLYNEANSIYYGSAWGNGMRDFKALLIKAAAETPGCYGWGHNDSTLGRCLDQPGVHEKLLAYLASAENAVQDDPRALTHVKRDRMFFSKTWEQFRKDYLANYRELNAYRKTAPVVIDAKITESDWKNANIISNFKTNASTPAKVQTFARVTYDPEFIYFAIEGMEPVPGQMVANITERDGSVWDDNGLEIFISYPDLGEDYFHWIINSNGVVYDAMNRKNQKTADKSFDGKAEIKTAVLNDRWVAEVKIPTASLGMKCFDGHVWKINVARSRKLTDKTCETSSWSNGTFHGTGGFLPVAFAGKRNMLANSFIETDSRLWKNGSFNETAPRKGQWKDWSTGNDELTPKSWIPHTAKGALVMVLNENSKDNYFVKLSSGNIFQFYTGKYPALNISLKAAGNGVLGIAIFRYSRNKKGDGFEKYIGSELIKKIELNSTGLQDLKIYYEKKNPDEVVALALMHNAGEIWLDDVYVMGTEAVPAPAKRANDR